MDQNNFSVLSIEIPVRNGMDLSLKQREHIIMYAYSEQNRSSLPSYRNDVIIKAKPPPPTVKVTPSPF